MNNSEVRRLVIARLDADPPMQREIEILKASLLVPSDRFRPAVSLIYGDDFSPQLG